MVLKSLFKKQKYFFISIIFLCLISFSGQASLIFLPQEERKPEVQVAEPARVAELYLSGPAEAAVNQNFNAELFLNTQTAEVNGVDILLQLSHLRLNSITPATNQFPAFLPIEGEANEVFKQAEIISQANQTGRLEFGAVTFDFNNPANPDDGEVTAAVQGNNLKIADLNLTLLDNSGELSFDFYPGETTDSNVASGGNDVLAEARGLTVNSPASSPTPSGEPSCPHANDGDGNCDNQVDDLDYVVWWQSYGASGSGDFNDDGITDDLDYVIWWRHYGESWND